jgi:hypothetical protein
LGRAIVLTSIVLCFLLRFSIERWVDHFYGYDNAYPEDPPVDSPVDRPTGSGVSSDNPFIFTTPTYFQPGQQNMIQKEWRVTVSRDEPPSPGMRVNDVETGSTSGLFVGKKKALQFKRQCALFLVLEFGVIFRSAIIGLNPATTGAKFKVLFPVIVFHRK